MPKLIRCECGYIARGDTDDEVIAALEEHLRQAHPDLAAKVPREEIFGWIEEA